MHLIRTTSITFISFSLKAQAQECLLEKTLLDNRKSHLIAKICAQVRRSVHIMLIYQDNSRSVIYPCHSLATINTNVMSDCRCVIIIRIVWGCWIILNVCREGFRKSGESSSTWRSATSVPSHMWDLYTNHMSMHFHKLVGYFHKPYIILFSLVTHGKAVRGTAEIWRSSKFMRVNMF